MLRTLWSILHTLWSGQWFVDSLDRTRDDYLRATLRVRLLHGFLDAMTAYDVPLSNWRRFPGSTLLLFRLPYSRAELTVISAQTPYPLDELYREFGDFVTYRM